MGAPSLRALGPSCQGGPPAHRHEAQKGKQSVIVPPLSGRSGAAGLRTIADCIAKRQSNIAKTIEGRKILKECREAQRRRASPPTVPSPPHVVGSGD